jgi:CRISPR-associated protein Cmr2
MTDSGKASITWDAVLLAWLHDPPDKALSILGHVPRARDNARLALGDDGVSKKRIEEAVTDADPMAAVVERLPMPTAGEKGEHAVSPQDGRLCVFHPLSGAPIDLQVPDLTQQLMERQREELRGIVRDLPSDEQERARTRLLGVWRLWPELLAANVDPCFARIPADTRIPDHTIWNHLDVAAAFKAALADGSGAALLAFALGPVQQFIEASRSVRDLWSGSMILSWLAFRAMLPVIERLGPTALIYPALRGNPLLDLWLRDAQRLGNKVSLPEVALRLTPSLPHRFLALVPWGNDGSVARELADQCRQAVVHAWKEMSDLVRNRVRGTLDALFAGWDKRWDDQIANYFSASSAIVPLAGSGDEVDKRLASLLAGEGSFAQAFPDAERVRGIARAIPESDRPGYPQDHAGRWQYQVELVSRVLAAQRSIRHVPRTSMSSEANARFPQKCTLLGSFEQMGPDDLAESKNFWDKVADSPNGVSIDGVRIRKGEALCAVAMVKRFAGPAFLANTLGVRPADLRFPDAWTVAAADWLSNAGIDPDTVRSQYRDWNGQWLHWETEHHDPDEPECPSDVLRKIREARDRLGRAPVYYAILKLDGDDLGGWLRGEKSPKVREVMHPKLVEYYEELGDAATAGLDAKRPVSPGLHAAISTALANFALHAVPEIVPRHHGTTIYSGGDDTLVLLPVSTALKCALELRKAYMSDWWRPNGNGGEVSNNREYLMMGSRATLSGGLVIVHAKDDLRLALQDARRAERQAKEAGKDALVITVRRRSGEHTSALCPWDFADRVEHWRQQFAAGASDRWAYRLYAERPTLEHLPVEAIKDEIRRQVKRSEAPTPTLFPPDDLITTFDAACRATTRFPSVSAALRTFLTLCHTASFLARGRD